MKPENDHNGSSCDDSEGIGRSYECNFCKRGFTNAQALGGHMNIHRKDKGKVKNKNHQHEASVKSDEFNYGVAGSRHFPHMLARTESYDQQKLRYYWLGRKVKYQVYLPSSSNPNLHIENFSLPVWRPESVVEYPNLSLRIGSSMQQDGVGINGSQHVEEIKVDLELRLGYDP